MILASEQVDFLLQTQVDSEAMSGLDPALDAFFWEVSAAFHADDYRRLTTLIYLAKERARQAAKWVAQNKDMVYQHDLTGVVCWSKTAGTQLADRAIYQTSWLWVANKAGYHIPDLPEAWKPLVSSVARRETH